MGDLVSKAARLHPIAKIGILGITFGLFWMILVDPEAQKEAAIPVARIPVIPPKSISSPPPPKPILKPADQQRGYKGNVPSGVAETKVPLGAAETTNSLLAPIPHSAPQPHLPEPPLEVSKDVLETNVAPVPPRPRSDTPNLNRCLNGYFPCDRQLLSEDERVRVD